MKPYTVNVIIYGARGLKSKSGKHKFCVEAKVNKAKQKSDLIEDLFDNPTFNKEFIFPVDSLNYELKLKIKEKNDRDILGQVKVHLTDLQQYKSDTPERAPLRPHKKCHNPSGELLFDAWTTGAIDPTNLNVKKKTLSIESLKSMSGLKKLKEKFHSSVKLHHQGKNEDGENDSIDSEKKKKNKFFSLKNRGAVSCQDLSTTKKGLQLFPGKTLEKNFLDSNIQNSSPGGSIENLTGDIFQTYNKRLSTTGSDAMKYKLLPPEVTGLSPKSGSANGGTVVTIRGSNLGESGGDLLHVYVCGVDMIKSTKYISSSKLVCTTLPCQPCSGNVIIETKFGGLGSSTVEFSFVEKNEYNPDYEEIKLVADKSKSISLSNEDSKIFSDNNKDNDSIGSGGSGGSGSLFKNRNLGIIRESSSDESSEESNNFGSKITTNSSNQSKKLREDSAYSSITVSNSDVSEKKYVSKSDKIILSSQINNVTPSDEHEDGRNGDKIQNNKNQEDNSDNDYSVLVNKLNTIGNRNSVDSQMFNNYEQASNKTSSGNKSAQRITFNSTKEPCDGNEDKNKSNFDQIISKPIDVKTSHISVQLSRSPEHKNDKEVVFKKITFNNIIEHKDNNDVKVESPLPKPRAEFRISQESSSDEDSPGRRVRNNIVKVNPPSTEEVPPSTTINDGKWVNDLNFKSELKLLGNLSKEDFKKGKEYVDEDNSTNDIVDKIVTGNYEKTVEDNLFKSNSPIPHQISPPTTTIHHQMEPRPTTIHHEMPPSTTQMKTNNSQNYTAAMRDKSVLSSAKNSDFDILSRKSLIDINNDLFPIRPVENNDVVTSDYSLEKKIVEIQPLSRKSNDSKNNLYIKGNSPQHSLNSLSSGDNSSLPVKEPDTKLKLQVVISADSPEVEKELMSGKSSSEEKKKKLIPDMNRFSFDSPPSSPPPSQTNPLKTHDQKLGNVQANPTDPFKSFDQKFDSGLSGGLNNGSTNSRNVGDASTPPAKPPRMKDFIDSERREPNWKLVVEHPGRPIISSNSNESYELDNSDVLLMKDNRNNNKDRFNDCADYAKDNLNKFNNFNENDVIKNKPKRCEINDRHADGMGVHNNNTAIISHFKESEKPLKTARNVSSSSSLSSSQLPSSSSSSSSSYTMTDTKLNLIDDGSDVKVILKKLMSDLEARDDSLKELQLRNRSLQEERDLLRKYIEVLISRALSTCPEILSRDDRKISFK